MPFKGPTIWTFAQQPLNLIFSLALSVAMIGCAAAPPAQQEEPAKPIRWRSIFTVQSDGGKFRVQVLDEDLTIRAVEGIAHIMQDDLENTYDLCAGGSIKYKP